LAGGRNMLSIKLIDVKTASVERQKTKIITASELLDNVEPLSLELMGEKASTNTVQIASEPQKNDPTITNNDAVESLVRLIASQCKKPEKYKTDEERFATLNTFKKVPIEQLIVTQSLLLSIVEPVSEREDVVSFFVRSRDLRNQRVGLTLKMQVEDGLLFFIDGTLIGFGTATRGLLVNIPREKFNGLHTISLISCTFDILKNVVDLSKKNYYLFDWNGDKAVKLLN
jgi:hypothetical protein